MESLLVSPVSSTPLALLADGLARLWPILLAAFGIGLVIFVHEAGHFLAARACKVRVEVFSLGFGPKLFGWRRGGTLYQVAVLPLGGFVKMAGEEGQASGRQPASDELGSKSVGQRFLIYSGGVLANVAFGLVVFPVILSSGVPFESPVLGAPAPGSPAWRAGIEPGTRVLRVNGNEVFGFIHITNEVALGSPQETVLEVIPPGRSDPVELRFAPVYNEAQGISWIGQRPASDPEGELAVEPGSPAARAGLATGDRLVSVEGGIEGLPLEERMLLPMLAGEPLSIEVERDGVRQSARIEPEPHADSEQKILGVSPMRQRVAALRASALEPRFDLRVEDRLLAVDGRAIVRDFDFLRALLAGSGPYRVEVERDGREVELVWPALSKAEIHALENDVALALDEASTRVAVTSRSAAEEAGLADGDRILAIDGRPLRRYQDVYDAAQGARDGRRLALLVERPDGGQLELEVAPRAWRPFNYGLGLQPERYIYQASSPLEAVRVGVASSWKLIQDSWLTVKRMVLGQVSGKNMGGIITISVVSHSWASEGLAKLFFFLCMLSMNLAFLNVLPIPVLDGGHLLFLLIEKLKGSPVSERVLGYSQMVGIVLILSLMVYVTFNDILRLTGS